MAEFSIIERQMLIKKLSDRQKLLFNSQYDSAKKDRGLVLILSVLLGTLGVDRFMIGDIGMGILKLLTGGVCGILWLIDIFTIRGKVDDYNRKKAHEILQSIQMFSNEETSSIGAVNSIPEPVAIPKPLEANPKSVVQPIPSVVNPSAANLGANTYSPYGIQPAAKSSSKNGVIIATAVVAGVVALGLGLTLISKLTGGESASNAAAIRSVAPTLTQAPVESPVQAPDAMSENLYDQAMVAYSNREFDKALTLLQVARNLEPTNPKIINAISAIKNAQSNAVNNMQIR